MSDIAVNGFLKHEDDMKSTKEIRSFERSSEKAENPEESRNSVGNTLPSDSSYNLQNDLNEMKYRPRLSSNPLNYSGNKETMSSDFSKNAQNEASEKTYRHRLSHHSLSLSGDSTLADLISKARSEFSSTLREDMKQFDSSNGRRLSEASRKPPDLSEHSPTNRRLSEISRRLPDLNENSLFADPIGDEKPKVNGISKSSLKLDLQRGPTLPVTNAADSPRSPLLSDASSPRSESRSLSHRSSDENIRSLSPRSSDENLRSLSPRLSDETLRSLSPRLSEILSESRASMNRIAASPRLNEGKGNMMPVAEVPRANEGEGKSMTTGEVSRINEGDKNIMPTEEVQRANEGKGNARPAEEVSRVDENERNVMPVAEVSKLSEGERNTMPTEEVSRLNQGKRNIIPAEEVSSVEITKNPEPKQDYLELTEKIQKQEDEILILRTALADVVRRLETLESEKKQKGNGMNSSWNNGNMKGILPAAAILPSQPKSPVKGVRDSIEEEKEKETPKSPDKEKTFPVKKQLTRRASDVPKKSPLSPSPSSQTPSVSNSVDKRRGSLTRRSTSDLRRSGSLSNLSNGEKDENAAVKFFIRGRAVNVYPPTNFAPPKKSGAAPEKQMKLEWVYGYRGRDSRNNLLTLASGEIIYHIAAVVIIFNRNSGEQRHYVGHNDDIKCIAVHPGKVIVASGQVAGHDKDEGKPHVRIWDSNTLETLHVIGIGYFERALCCLAFSIKDGGKLLAAIDEANEHVISLWDWEKKLRYSENKSSNEAVVGALFHPTNNNVIVSHGRSHIAFWNITDDMKISKKMGIFERHGKPKFVLCATFTEHGDLLSGDSNGNLLVWSQGTNRVSKAIKEAHDGAIFSICCMSDGKILSGGGKDRKIIEWNQSLEKTGTEIELPEYSGQVRAITEGQMQDDDTIDIIVGTTKNCILDGSLSSGLGIIVQGHVDELWGLATHPTKEIFVTCAIDEKVILWDAEGHDAVWTKQLKESAQSAAFHPIANVIAIGTKSGRWMVIDGDTTEEIAVFQDGPEQHDAIKYSRDGKYIAVGSHDNFIYLYTVSEDGRAYKRAGKLSGHSSFITHLDWSKDSQHLQSNSGDYEILFWHAPTCRRIVAANSMRDVEWETWTCVLGFPVLGIWPDGADGTDINACCRSSNSEHVVTGDDFGQVNFFNYPVTKPKSECQHCIGHSSHVTCVRFTSDDTRVISVGGKDCSVMQWRIS